MVVVNAFEFSIGYVPIGMTDSPLMMSAEYSDHVELVRQRGEQRVDKARDGARRGRGDRRASLVDEGRPVEVLLEAARDHDAQLIVVGSHGEGAVSAAFLGSTALKLLHHSDIPVLVVPRHKD